VPADPALPFPDRLRIGARAGLPYAAAGFVLSLSFGVVAREAGVGPLAAIVMSAVVFAGSAQFASLAILAGGGTLVAAVSAGALVMSRFLPMGVALGPSLKGSRWRRALEGQAVVDSSWAMAARGDGTYDRPYLFGHTGVQYVGWVLGTLAGVLVAAVGGALDDRALGLDAVFPAFFTALLIAELKNRRALGVAGAGALVALLLVPVTPLGVPVLVASVTSLVGLRRPGPAASPGDPAWDGPA